MSDTPFDLRYAPTERVHQLETRVAVLENEIRRELSNIKEQNNRIEAKLNERVQQPNAGADQIILLGHRFMDKMDKMTTRAGVPSWAVVCMGAAILFLGYRAVVGHW